MNTIYRIEQDELYKIFVDFNTKNELITYKDETINNCIVLKEYRPVNIDKYNFKEDLYTLSQKIKKDILYEHKDTQALLNLGFVKSNDPDILVYEYIEERIKNIKYLTSIARHTLMKTADWIGYVFSFLNK